MKVGGRQGDDNHCVAGCVLGVCEDDHDGADDGGRSGDDGSADDWPGRRLHGVPGGSAGSA